MTKTEQLDRLFERWRENYAGKPFAEDGIIKEELWDKAPKKILLIMKESNQFPGDLRALAYDSPWRVEGYWSYGLQNTNNEIIPLIHTAYDDLNWKSAFRSSALLNLKKSPGGAAARMDLIRREAQRDSEFILAEMDIIEPDLVICCATFQICRTIFVQDDFVDVGPDKRCYSYGGRLWFDYCHPGAHYPHDMMYYTLMLLYQNCLKEISLEK